MGFLDSLKSMFDTGGGQTDKSGYWVYVRCHRCGEGIKTRLDLQHDLNRRDEGGYIVRKTLVGSRRCFERIDVTLIFDESRRVVEQEAVGGSIITAQEFEEIEPPK